MGLVENDKNVVDLAIPALERKRFRINGDNNKILELNTSDPNILPRLRKGYKDLLKLASSMSKLDAGDEDIDTDKLSDELLKLDKQMKTKLDYIFDSNVSEVCVGNASVYTLNGGKFRFEDIIESLGALYSEAFTSEFEAMQERLKKHTSKYTGS